MFDAHSLLSPVAGITLGAVVVYFLHLRATAVRYLPDSIPWVGCRKEPFSRTRANLREWKLGLEYLKEGYAKYTKNGLLFATPNVTFYPEVMAPASLMQWIFKQPDDVLSKQEVQRHVLATDYIFRKSPLRDDLHISVIRHDLTRHLGILLPVLTEAIRAAIDENWGTDSKNWTEKNVSDTVNDLVKRLSPIALFGEPLCLDKEFRDLLNTQAHVWAFSAAAIRILVPEVLKPVLGPAIGLIVRYYNRRINRYVEPEIRSRVRALQSEAKDQTEQQNDVLQYLILSYKATYPTSPDLSKLLNVMLMLNFASIHTQTVSLTAVLYDILSFPPQPNRPHVWDLIRSEALSALHTPPSTTTTQTPKPWDRPTLTQNVPFATSCIRESMRRSSLGGRTLVHQVVAREGLTLTLPAPLNKTYHLPYGARIGVPATCIHLDPDHYSDPEKFDPFRFVGKGAEMEGGGDVEGEGEGEASVVGGSGERRVRIDVSRTTDTFLPFSHGPRACPGRFFASALLKMMLLELAMRYEVRPLEERPKNIVISDATVPSGDATVWVRRRENFLSE